jgi:transcription initiation factor TFIID subunit 7
VLENVNPDLSDSEFIEREDEGLETGTPGPMGSEAGDVDTAIGEDEDDQDDEGGEEGDGDIDEALAAELDLALGDDEGDEEEEEEEDSDEDEEEDDDEEGGQAQKLLNEEIRDLQAAVAKKDREIASSANPLIRVKIFIQIHADWS